MTTPGQRFWCPARDDGFSLAELLISVVLAMVIFGAVVSFLSVQVMFARTQPDAADLQQRARIAADILSAELSGAGAWTDSGGIRPGLVCCVPVVHPRRLGTRLADPVGAARPDVLTLVRAAAGAVAGRLREPMAGHLALASGAGCTPARPVCGMQEDDAVVVFDAMGHHDFFLLGPPASDSAPVTLRQASAPYGFLAGALAVAAETRTFYHDPGTRQLRQYDGHLSDVPIVDDVVGVRFEYWGDAGVPVRSREESGTSTCWFDVDGLPRFGRGVTPAGAPHVRLELAEFRDGPWCGAGGNRFDADLLRIRRVRAIVRLGATSDAARGMDDRFQAPGRATSALRLVPDMEVVVDAAPGNLNADY